MSSVVTNQTSCQDQNITNYISPFGTPRIVNDVLIDFLAGAKDLAQHISKLSSLKKNIGSRNILLDLLLLYVYKLAQTPLKYCSLRNIGAVKSYIEQNKIDLDKLNKVDRQIIDTFISLRAPINRYLGEISRVLKLIGIYDNKRYSNLK